MMLLCEYFPLHTIIWNYGKKQRGARKRELKRSGSVSAGSGYWPKVLCMQTPPFLYPSWLLKYDQQLNVSCSNWIQMYKCSWACLLLLRYCEWICVFITFITTKSHRSGGYKKFHSYRQQFVYGVFLLPSEISGLKSEIKRYKKN